MGKVNEPKTQLGVFFLIKLYPLFVVVGVVVDVVEHVDVLVINFSNVLLLFQRHWVNIKLYNI